jgi:putative membrane protein
MQDVHCRIRKMWAMDKKRDFSSTRNRDHMANERTLLAWVRTSIGIMAFGFVIEKFSLFLQKLAGVVGPGYVSLVQQRSASFFGICLVALGGVLCGLGFFKYKKHKKQIDEGKFQESATLGAFLTSIVIVTGIFLVVYLVNSR